MSLFPGFLTHLQRDTKAAEEPTTPEATTETSLDRLQPVRSPVSSPPGLARRPRHHLAEVHLSATTSNPEHLRLSFGKDLITSSLGTNKIGSSSEAETSSVTLAADIPIGSSFSLTEQPHIRKSQPKSSACSRAYTVTAMVAKSCWLGLAEPLDDDNGKKGRSKCVAHWQLGAHREPCTENARNGTRASSDNSGRKRQSLGRHMLPVMLLMGFVMVMVSFSSLNPAAVKQIIAISSPGSLPFMLFIAQWRLALQLEIDPGSSGDAHIIALEGQLSDALELERRKTKQEDQRRALWVGGQGTANMFNVQSTSGASNEQEVQERSISTSDSYGKRLTVVSKVTNSRNSPVQSPLAFLMRALKWSRDSMPIEDLPIKPPPAPSQANGQGTGVPARVLARPENERQLWLPPNAEGLQICIDRAGTYKEPASHGTNGHLIVTANGGLNQMRAAICDMVAVARIMNATLVVPRLDHSSFWADPSNFEDIFQLEHFMEELRKDIRIVKDLPESLKDIKPLEIFPVSWSPFKYYRKDLLRKLKKHKVMVFPLTDSRLANNKLPESIQRLRCRANYRALKYTPEIESVASSLVQRLREKGPYIALHLRYEKDMLAFTGCTHGLTKQEGEELKSMRMNNSRWKEKEIDGEVRRKDGLCPLTPAETALFLRAMGFPNTSVIYIAAGDIYGSHGLADLTALYPKTFTHSTLAMPDELQRLEKFQNRMAAVDYTVAVESDVFVYTYEGNMARAVQGHRRFEGHRKTILPDRRLIVKYIDMFRQGFISWSAFKHVIKTSHQDRLGGSHMRNTGINPKFEENFFANPYPGCICEGPTPNVSS